MPPPPSHIYMNQEAMHMTQVEKEIIQLFHRLSPENKAAFLDHLQKVVEAQGVTK